MRTILPKSDQNNVERAEAVILLHGLARTARSMRRMEQALAALGYQVLNVDHPSRSSTIQRLASHTIEQALEQIPSASSAVHFVTHSMGGILLRCYLAQQPIDKLGRVVMLGPPNQGSEVVDTFGKLPGFRWLNGAAGTQLGTRRDSVPRQLGPVTFELGVVAGTQSVNPILSLALRGPNDGKVTIEAAKVEGMADFLALPLAHPFLMRSKLVIEQTVHFLQRGRFADVAD